MTPLVTLALVFFGARALSSSSKAQRIDKSAPPIETDSDDPQVLAAVAQVAAAHHDAQQPEVP